MVGIKLALELLGVVFSRRSFGVAGIGVHRFFWREMVWEIPIHKDLQSSTLLRTGHLLSASARCVVLAIGKLMDDWCNQTVAGNQSVISHIVDTTIVVGGKRGMFKRFRISGALPGLSGFWRYWIKVKGRLHLRKRYCLAGSRQSRQVQELR
jgi:hypothetical protein